MPAFQEGSISIQKLIKGVQKAVEKGSLTFISNNAKAGVRITDMDFTESRYKSERVVLVLQNTTNIYNQPTDSELRKIVVKDLQELEKETEMEPVPPPPCFADVVEVSKLASGDILP